MRRKHLMLTLLLVVASAACNQEGGGPVAGATEIEASAVDFSFQGVPDEIEGGVVDLTFTNEGEARHEFAVVHAEGVGQDDFIEGFAPVLEGGPFPDFMDSGAAVFDLEPGETKQTSFTLPEGEYYLFCALDDAPGGEGEDQETGDSHLTLGMIQPLSVEGDNGAELEAEGGTFTATDYTFEAPDEVPAGTNSFIFRNASDEQWHHMVLQAFDEGVTPEQATEATKTIFELEEGAAPPEGTPEGEDAGSTGVLGPGSAQTVELELEAGRTYVAMCFIQDTTGGPPHAIAHQMYRAFTVGG